MTFVKRAIDVTITLGGGKYGEEVVSTDKLTGLRVDAYIHQVGGEPQGIAHARIYGLSLDMINKLTSIGPVATEIRGQNKIQIDAGDEGGQMSTIFKGGIVTAFGEFQTMPDVPLVVQGASAAVAALKPLPGFSQKGTVKVADMMAAWAKQAGWAFENNGVTTVVKNPHYDGSALQKIESAARHFHIHFSVHNETLAIWPAGGHRAATMPVVSPQTGLVGYPSFNSNYMVVRTMFLPTVQQGGQFELRDSEITAANGSWNIATLHHHLQSQTPNGQWFTEMKAYRAQPAAA